MRSRFLPILALAASASPLSPPSLHAASEPPSAPRTGPDFLDAGHWFRLGLNHNSAGHYHEAADAFRRGLDINPRDPVAWFSLGTAYGMLDRHQEAADALLQAIRLAPDFFQAYNNLGVAYENLGALNDAVAAYREAVRLQPDNGTARFNLGRSLLAAGNRVEALLELETLRTLNTPLSQRLEELLATTPAR